MFERHTQLHRTAGKSTTAVLRVLGGVALGTLAVLSTAGCSARTQTRAVVYSEPMAYDDAVVVVQTAPVEVESYPRHHYRGAYVYLVDGQWYWRSRGRWVVYRAEPRELATVRVSYEAKYGRNYRPRNEAASPPRVRHHRHDRP